MIGFFYTLIIFPIVQLIECFFVFTYRVYNNPVFALLGVSIAISVCTLPLYFFAEKYQQKERELQNRMKAKIKSIKAVFKGDEQYMILSAYYRQNHYHPLYAMRSSLGLLIQIPFFIAAYTYLSHLEMLQGTSFLFVKDLGLPDGIITAGAVRINIFTIIMTLINLVSGMIYAKGLYLKDKLQLYGISLLFFILLYNSSSGLVLYWTMNNLFSLVKNIFQKIKSSKKILYVALFPVILLLDYFFLFLHSGDLPNRLLAAFLVSAAYALPLFIQFINSGKKRRSLAETRKKPVFPASVFFLSCIILFLLLGIIIPSSLIASSVEEFSFIDSMTTPFPFILQTMIQGAGIFLLWFSVIYFLSSGHFILTFTMVVLTGISMVNTFLITENFGFFTLTMTLSEPKPFSLIPGIYITNALIVLLTMVLLLLLLFFNKTRILMAIQIIAIIALSGYGIINMRQIKDDFSFIKNNSQTGETENFLPQYAFSTTGKNVLLIMLDCGIGSYVPYIFEEKPELNSMMRGFHLYPNCISFANHTLIGALPIYGGYEYTPVAVNHRDKTPLVEKQQEAYLLLPKIFYNNGFSVTITDPPFDNHTMSNLAIFSDYPEIDAKNLLGKYTKQWIRNNQEISVFSISELLKDNLIRFSFFKSVPLFLRPFIYDKGNWFKLSSKSKEKITDVIINDYAYLDTLDKITTTAGSGNTYTAIYSHLPHEPIFMQAPDYTLTNQTTNRGESALADNERFHVMTASFLLLGKWFDYLKKINVYDNTRIILVSDHGRGSADIPGNIILQNGGSIQSYNALLMIKDFDASGELTNSGEFMTNGDVPLLALKDIIDNPVNPFTGIPLKADKEGAMAITTIGALSTYRHTKYTYNIGKSQWLYVRDDIFKQENWSAVSEE